MSRKLTTKAAVADKIMDTVRAQGGKVPRASTRRLGRMIGASKSTVHNSIAALIASGVLERIGADIVLRS